jgi:hypothetical protein
MIEVLHKLPLDEISEIEELGRRCHKLDVVGPSYATVELEVKDLKSGDVVSQYADLCHSFTLNHHNVLAGQQMMTSMAGFGSSYAVGQLVLKNTAGSIVGDGDVIANIGGDTAGSYTGASFHTDENNVSRGWRGAAGSSTVGIIVGSGTGAEALTDYVLTPITSFSYGAMGNPAVTWDAGTKKFKSVRTRVFTNDTAGTLTVTETGIYGGGVGQVIDNADHVEVGIFCWIRDKLADAVACATVSMLTVTYTLYSPAYPA